LLQCLLEQFYLLFPLLFLAWARGTRGRWISLGLFALVSMASLLHAAVLGLREAPPSWAFYATSTRLWQLGVGVLLFQLLHVRESLDPATGQAHTAHTNLPVPLIYVGDKALKAVEGGKLSDIAPTMLTLMGMEIPKEMTGKPLFIVE